MKTQHDFITQARAFLDTIGYKYTLTPDHYSFAQFWTRNQEKIITHIAGFCGEKPRIYAGYIRMFGMLSQSAKYLNEYKTTANEHVEN